MFHMVSTYISYFYDGIFAQKMLDRESRTSGMIKQIVRVLGDGFLLEDSKAEDKGSIIRNEMIFLS